jgi:hypothetical protein
LLDADGFCRVVIPTPDADDAARKAAQRCVGAQYVASIDLDVEGYLASEPKAARQLLFATVSIEGRVALIRTAPLLEMRSLDGTVAPVATSPILETVGLEDEEPVMDLAVDEDDEEDVETCTELTAPFSRSRPLLEPLRIPAPRDSAPPTVQGPRTVRGFPPPPPPPIAIASRLASRSDALANDRLARRLVAQPAAHDGE